MIAKAIRLDGKGSIEGYYFKIWNEHFIQCDTTNGKPTQKKINPKTLKYSFDNGVSWFSESGILTRINFYEDGSFGG